MRFQGANRTEPYVRQNPAFKMRDEKEGRACAQGLTCTLLATARENRRFSKTRQSDLEQVNLYELVFDSLLSVIELSHR